VLCTDPDRSNDFRGFRLGGADGGLDQLFARVSLKRMIPRLIDIEPLARKGLCNDGNSTEAVSRPLSSIAQWKMT
jgi:hypothetical protein